MDVFAYSVLVFLLIIILVRNQIVYSARTRAIEYVYGDCTDLERINNRHPVYDAVGYYRMMFQFSKWTFAGFYPTFKEESP